MAAYCGKDFNYVTSPHVIFFCFNGKQVLQFKQPFLTSTGSIYPSLHDVNGDCYVFRVVGDSAPKQLRHVGAYVPRCTATQYHQRIMHAE